MKSIFYTALCGLWMGLSACGQTGGGLIENPASGTGEKSKGGAKIEFASMKYDFGKVNAGAIVKHVFRFRNGGNGDLIIAEARPSCGCTASNYPRNPVAPGDSASISVEFNTENKAGDQNKTITIISNSNPGAVELALKGFVVNPDETGPIKP